MRGSSLLGSLCSLGCAAVLLVGCSGDSEDNDGSSAAVCQSLPPLAVKDSYRVGFAQLWEDHGPWRDANTASMVDEAEKRGFELVYEPGTKADPSEQVARMQALIDAKVDAIIVAPHDETVLAPSVVAARRACIPTFIVDRAVDPQVAIPGEDYVSYLASDFRREGEMAAEWLIEKTGGVAQIIELEGTIGSSPGVQRKKGFDERIVSEEGMKILASESADFDEDKGYEATLRLVPEHPEVNVIYSHNDGMSFGVITALEELGKVPGEDILVVSIDGTKKATQYILDGKIAVVVECNPRFGPIVFDTLVDYAQGKKVPLRIDNVDRVFDIDNAAEYLPDAY
ncbi:MAG: sugar ABC transporter substrate-binding protein [Myxococcales bacterium]|nr:MAG: sugar ABC transporter substrate-binding protein [Myxococcales bacterium]